MKPVERLRIVGLADTDSYVKWGASLLGSVRDAADVTMLVVETPLVVSAAQQRAALAGAGLGDERVRRVEYAALAAELAELRPDAVLVAARGPLARVLARLVAEMSPRPVIVTGLPGISIPATSRALQFRAQCDLFVLHSTREMREFAALAASRGLTHRFALSRLPFAEAGARRGRAAPGTDLVFATQAIVPRERAERIRVAQLLIAAAEADPSRRVVVKLRASAGEKQTHREVDDYRDLLARLSRRRPLPANLVVSTGPMARALDTAEGLVTVSSTAAIEAVARGIPVVALDVFGVSDQLINPVFVGSGLLAGEQAVIDAGSGIRIRSGSPTTTSTTRSWMRGSSGSSRWSVSVARDGCRRRSRSRAAEATRATCSSARWRSDARTGRRRGSPSCSSAGRCDSRCAGSTGCGDWCVDRLRIRWRPAWRPPRPSRGPRCRSADSVRRRAAARS